MKRCPKEGYKIIELQKLENPQKEEKRLLIRLHIF